MKAFTKEQLDILSEWEDRFYTSTVAKYYRNISSKSLDKIKAVYDSVDDNPYVANWSCNHCVLAFLAKVGKKYFEDKKALEEKAAKLVESLDEIMDEVADIPKKVTKPSVKRNTTNKKNNKKK